MSTTFRLPDLGEGLADAEVVRWLVAVDDEVAVDQPLVEVETAKAVVEVPSPLAGRVADLCAGEGDVVAVGAPLVAVDELTGAASGDDGGGRSSAGDGRAAVAERPVADAAEGESGDDGPRDGGTVDDQGDGPPAGGAAGRVRAARGRALAPAAPPCGRRGESCRRCRCSGAASRAGGWSRRPSPRRRSSRPRSSRPRSSPWAGRPQAGRPRSRWGRGGPLPHRRPGWPRGGSGWT